MKFSTCGFFLDVSNILKFDHANDVIEIEIYCTDPLNQEIWLGDENIEIYRKCTSDWKIVMEMCVSFHPRNYTESLDLEEIDELQYSWGKPLCGLVDRGSSHSQKHAIDRYPSY